MVGGSVREEDVASHHEGGPLPLYPRGVGTCLVAQPGEDERLVERDPLLGLSTGRHHSHASYSMRLRLHLYADAHTETHWGAHNIISKHAIANA